MEKFSFVNDKNEMMAYAESLLRNSKRGIHVCVSHTNKKMGENILSVSMWPFYTCKKCGCMGMKTKKRRWCYAINMILRECQTMSEHFYSNVGESWLKNYWILKNEPELFWREVEASVMMSKFFRFHVGGDFENYDYFDRVAQISKRNPSTKILAFTKQFEFVNEWVDKNGPLPENLRVIFSAWPGLEMKNPHHLTECHVLMKDGSCTAQMGEPTFYCPGKCEECAQGCMGCWSAESKQILIKEH